MTSVDRPEAYTRRYKFLSAQTLPEGTIDLAANLPSSSVTLLAPAATLVVHEDFHPALVDLLLEAADEVHGAGGLFEGQHEFPAPRYLDFPLSKEARRFFESGPPFLRRTLPFWAATLIDRLKVMLLPLIALVIPLMKIMPSIYRWRVRSIIAGCGGNWMTDNYAYSGEDAVWFRESFSIGAYIDPAAVRSRFGKRAGLGIARVNPR